MEKSKWLVVSLSKIHLFASTAVKAMFLFFLYSRNLITVLKCLFLKFLMFTPNLLIIIGFVFFKKKTKNLLIIEDTGIISDCP